MTERTNDPVHPPAVKPQPARPWSEADEDERAFCEDARLEEFLRPAAPHEWPPGDELLTTPPYTLVVRVRPGLLLKAGAWSVKATSSALSVTLNERRLSLDEYVAQLRAAAL